MSTSTTVEISSSPSAARRNLLRHKLESIIELYATSLCRELIRPEFEAPLDTELARVASLLGMQNFSAMKAAKLEACIAQSRDKEPDIEENATPGDFDASADILETPADPIASELTSADNTKINAQPAERLTDVEWNSKYEQFFYEKYRSLELPRVEAETQRLESELDSAKKLGSSKDRIKELNDELRELKATKRRLEQKSVSTELLQSSRELSASAFERQNGTPTPEMVAWRIDKLSRESFEVVKNLDYFPTPPDVAARLIDTAQIKPGMSVLEPSAGKGNLADVIRSRFGDTVTIHCVEYSPHNAEILSLKGYDVTRGDFLETKGELYDRIVMNPPYMRGVDWVHIRHAYYNCLKPDGLLVALIPAGSVTGSGREALGNEEFIVERGGTITVIEAKDYNRQMEQQTLTINIALVTIPGRVEQKLERTKRTKTTDSGYQELPDAGEITLPERASEAIDTGFVKPDIVTAQAHLVPPESSIPKRAPEPLASMLLPHQSFGVNLAINALESRGGFLLADGTGAGKTIQMLTTATHFWRKEGKSVVIFTIDDRVIKTSFMEDAIKIGMSAPEYKPAGSTKESERPQRPAGYSGLYDKLPQSRSLSHDLPQVVMGDAKGFKLKPGINMFTYTALSLFKGSEEAEKAYNIAKGHRKFNETFWARIAALGRDAMKKKEGRDAFLERIGMEAPDTETARQMWFDRVSKAKYEDSFALQREYAELVRYDGAMPKIENAFVNFIKAEDARNESIKNTIREVIDETSLVIFDEAHKIKNLADQEEKGVGRAYYASFITRNTKRVLFATATPCDRPYDMLYLQRAGLFKDELQFRNIMRMVGIYYDAEKRNERGELVRRGRWKIDRSDKQRDFANINVSNLFSFITREGCMIRREIQYTNLDVNMVTVTVPDSVKQELAAITQECTSLDDKGRSKVDKLKELLRHTEAMEGYKLDATVELTRKELEEGRNVVIFTSFVDEEEREDGEDKLGSVRILKNRLAKLYGEKAVGVLVSAKGPYENFRRLENVAQFQTGERRVLIGTITSGGTGVNLDDQIGNAPRTIIIITAPLTFINVMQGIGRVVRANTKSRSRVNFLFAETDNPEPEKRGITIERWLRNILATKFKTLRAAVKGEIDVLDPDALARLEQTGSSGLVSAIEESGSTSKREHSWYTKSAKKLEGWTLPNQVPLRIERTADRYEHFVFISGQNREEMESWAKANKSFIEHWGLERNISGNYQRYNGLHYGAKFRTRGAHDLKESYDLWNALLNLLQPEDARWMQQEDTAFLVGETVTATTNIIYANVAPGARGTVQAVVPLLKGNAGTQELFTYQYDVLFENGFKAVSLERWQLKAEPGALPITRYSKGDAFATNRVKITVLEIDVTNGKTTYLIEQSYIGAYSYLEPEFHNIDEAVLEKLLAERGYEPFQDPRLNDDTAVSTNDETENSSQDQGDDSWEDEQHLEPPVPLYSIADAAKVKAKSLKLTKTKALFKNLCQRFNMLIWGLPGQGKSSFLLLLAHDLSQNGKVLLILREERVASGRIGARAKRLGIPASSGIILSDSMTLQQLKAYLEIHPDVQFVGVDSLQKWDNVSEEEIEQLIDSFPSVSFIFVAQSNKAGKEYRGFSKLANTVDTVLSVSDSLVLASKHRDGATGDKFKLAPSCTLHSTTRHSFMR